MSGPNARYALAAEDRPSDLAGDGASVSLAPADPLTPPGISLELSAIGKAMTALGVAFDGLMEGDDNLMTLLQRAEQLAARARHLVTTIETVALLEEAEKL